jgi:hypothetical protein
MIKAKPRALILLALWVFGSFAIVSLPRFAYAQTVVVDDSTPGTPSTAAGDPDMPGEKPPAANGAATLSPSSSGLYAGHSIDPVSWPSVTASARVNARASGRLWLESILWLLRARIGW